MSGEVTLPWHSNMGFEGLRETAAPDNARQIVHIDSVAKEYRRGTQTVAIFKDLNFHVDYGEFLAITGPSGSGKTTLLNLVGALDVPDRGTVSVLGVDVRSLSAAQKADWRARSVGFVFQLYHLLPFLNARENVEVPLALTGLGRKERRQRAMTALEITGVAAFSQHKPGQLSGGQAQRVAIARALVGDPQLLLCDEPTGDLDRHAAEDILGVLAALQRDHAKTILMVTHDPFAASYASRCVRLEKGVLATAERDRACIGYS